MNPSLLKSTLPLAALLLALPVMGLAQDAAAPAAEAAAEVVEAATPSFDDIGAYVMTTFLFLIGGILVMWMAAGFAMLEAGLVRSKNVTTQLTKNIALFAIAGIMYWLIGYNLMYPGDGWTIVGYLGTLFSPASLEPVGLAADAASLDYASGASDFFYQVMFCATTASIVSGTLAERIKLWPFLIFTVVLTGVLYPIEASWQWGGGWLSEMGFYDFAGSTLVHAAGGFAALAGALILGPRIGRYKDGRAFPMPGSNLALATLGTLILWMGWFGFNGASQLAAGTVGDISDIARIMANTNMAASAGAVAAMVLTQVTYGKVDLTMVLNGALAGLVSITAGPLDPSLFGALLIGAVGGIIAVLVVPVLDKLKIDDVVGAIPVHLVAGFWGTMIVPFNTADTSYVTQLVGFVSVGAFMFVLSLIVWIILKATIGLRVTAEAEMTGLDQAEMGMEAYPEFAKG
ncbi:ammonium transporter [Loktanella fryxellensis]|uniref:Ammonium transporter n=1 Tax=Loktanella fryxellensis TaxID=245187 RepID=A0A1H8FKA3_9RHOB|nr:ammonium transporter [Loktanella fryxellensis]SEN32311.1 ammonium transporter [Loktanella fryxellensis]